MHSLLRDLGSAFSTENKKETETGTGKKERDGGKKGGREKERKLGRRSSLHVMGLMNFSL
jgi:hypothetical protein